MKIDSKNEYFKKLRSKPEYLAALKKVSSAEERKQIIATVEYIAGNLFEALAFAAGTMREDPQIAQQISEALKTGDGIIKESDGMPITSGSRG
jgi:hypothetical protein